MRGILPLLLLNFLTACAPTHNPSLTEDLRGPIPDSLCYFFPPESAFYSEKYMTSDIPCHCLNPTGICTYFVVIEKTRLHCPYDSLIRFSLNHSIRILDDSSNCIPLKIRHFDKRDQLDSTYTTVQIEHIIPDFHISETLDCEWKDSTTQCGLSNGYSFYVIKSGSTLVLNQKWDCNRLWLPEHLQHGYRSGIALNPDIDFIVYWAMAW